IAGPCLREALEAQATGVAMTARRTRRIGIVAALRHRVVNAERQTELDDLCFRAIDERSLDANRVRALDAAARGEVRHPLVRGDVFRTAVRIARVVQRIHADE